MGSSELKLLSMMPKAGGHTFPPLDVAVEADHH